MTTNRGIKILSGVVVGVVILILLNRQPSSSNNSESNDAPPLTANIASQFNDGLRELSAKLHDTQKKIRVIEKENKTLRLQKVPNEISEKVTLPLIPEEITEAIRQLKDELNQMKADASEPHASHYDTPTNTQPPHEDIYKPNPLPPKRFKKTIPYYTIPASADLANTVLLSALMGEVPTDGKLMQPLFPFSALISRHDLMASNGVTLPADISGMKINGYAIGVGSFLDDISCVRAYVTSALFTFQDGHFVTIGQEETKSSAELVNNDSLGYLTTAYGNPCIHGKYLTNAPKVLTAMMAAGGIQGAGESLSQWQLSSFAGLNGVTQSPTGPIGSFLLGHAASEGSVKVADWIEKRLQGSFDLVFVPASHRTCHHTCRDEPTTFNFHVTKTIRLDKKLTGRKLNYAQSQNTIYDNGLR